VTGRPAETALGHQRGWAAISQLVEDALLLLGQGQQVGADPELGLAGRVNSSDEGGAAGDGPRDPVQLVQELLRGQL
jgi:hypothetical protein